MCFVLYFKIYTKTAFSTPFSSLRNKEEPSKKTCRRQVIWLIVYFGGGNRDFLKTVKKNLCFLHLLYAVYSKMSFNYLILCSYFFCYSSKISKIIH